MTHEGIVGRAVIGLMAMAVLCVLGIVVLAAAGEQTSETLTALSTLGGGASGALAALLTVSFAPGNTVFGGRRASDPPVSAAPVGSVVIVPEGKP